MKRFGLIALILLISAMILPLSSCGGNSSNGDAESTSEERLSTINQSEYVLYQNVFLNGYAKTLDGKTVKKVGVFATLHDAFSEVDRYYVWGYMDQTKCCDWQWEFVPKDGQKLPPDGSLVTVEGTFTYDEDALDDYWIKNATVKTTTKYTGPTYDVNMYVMSDTLERVQIANVERIPNYFQNKTFSAYGRVKTLTSIQDPYYDGSWYIGFTYVGSVPAIGTTVLLTGTLNNGALTAETLNTID